MELTRKSTGFDRAIYILLCLVSWGMVFLIRIVLTEAIRQAKDKD
jgi:hypothetical protein